LIHSPLVARALPMLVSAAREIGGRQIQHRGTIGGNVANASPAGDTLPVLAVADAVVELVSARGRREVPFVSFYTGYRQSAALPDELIAAFHIAPLSGTQWFRKVGTRAAQAISKIVVAGLAGDRPRLAAGSIAPTVVSDAPKRRWRRGIRLPMRNARCSPTSRRDIRSTAGCRRRVAANLVAQFCLDTNGHVFARPLMLVRGQRVVTPPVRVSLDPHRRRRHRRRPRIRRCSRGLQIVDAGTSVVIPARVACVLNRAEPTGRIRFGNARRQQAGSRRLWTCR
jgi:xanthine dehydrogenase iron-sulfur cluster and FAD-binding subunit A